jgi:hypothetical protein
MIFSFNEFGLFDLSLAVFTGIAVGSTVVFMLLVKPIKKYNVEENAECKIMKCGHSKCCLIDDHCGLPEHRYCAFCSSEEDSESYYRLYENLLDKNKELLKIMGGIEDKLSGTGILSLDTIKMIVKETIKKNTI